VVYLDANVFLFSLLYDPEEEPKAQRAREILTGVAHGRVRAFTSTLTWDEVVWVVWRLVGRPEALAVGEREIVSDDADLDRVDIITRVPL